MPSIDMSYVAAGTYFFGIYFHYIHVKTIFHLLDRYEEINKTKALFHSIIWPRTVLFMMWEELLGIHEEDDE